MPLTTLRQRVSADQRTAHADAMTETHEKPGTQEEQSVERHGIAHQGTSPDPGIDTPGRYAGNFTLPVLQHRIRAGQLLQLVS